MAFFPTRLHYQTSHVDLMPPNLMLCPGRVLTDSQDVSHLLNTDEENVTGNVESDALGTGWTGKTA